MSLIVEVITAPYVPRDGCAPLIEDCHLIPCETHDEALDTVLYLRGNSTLRVRVVAA